VLWAPSVDTTLSARRGYLIALTLTLGGVLASSLMPLSKATLGALTAVVMASQIGLTLMGFSCEQMLANVPAGEKGRAAGWYQAGNFFGLGLGGGLALELTVDLPARWMGAGILCAVLSLSAFAMLGLPSPVRGKPSEVEDGDGRSGYRASARLPERRPTLLEILGSTLRDLRDVVGEKVDGKWRLWLPGLAALFICLSPIGAGAGGNYWPSIATHWSAPAAWVEGVNGWLGGIVGAGGALVGGWLADKLPRRTAYAVGGGLTALSGILFALGPRVPWAYAIGVLVYTFFNGIAFACFSALVLETIGHGTVATKYNIFASLANLAVTYMTLVDGQAYKGGHESRLLFADAGATFIGIAAMFVFMRILASIAARRPAAPAERPPLAT
jgi:PAT family beta-lactamase induction signal transducer AmpG